LNYRQTLEAISFFLPNSITLSPVSIAAKGMVSEVRGLSIRFPRFLRLREDKKIEDSSTPEFLATMWRKQDAKPTANEGQDEGDLIDPDSESSPESEEDVDP
jgi:DNA ligase 1